MQILSTVSVCVARQCCVWSVQISLFTDPLFSLQSPSSVGDKNNINHGGFIDRQRKGVVEGGK